MSDPIPMQYLQQGKAQCGKCVYWNKKTVGDNHETSRGECRFMPPPEPMYIGVPQWNETYASS
jgi:hypothetical protein